MKLIKKKYEVNIAYKNKIKCNILKNTKKSFKKTKNFPINSKKQVYGRKKLQITYLILNKYIKNTQSSQ